jgi:hypothetical protein
MTHLAIAGLSWSLNDVLAFADETAHYNSGTYEIFTVNIDGTNLRQLTNNVIMDIDPDWSSDGSQIVWAESSGMEVVETSLFSPDDSKIAFVSRKSGNLNIWLMDRDGSNLVQVTANVSEDRYLDWGVSTLTEIPDRTAEWTFETDVVTDDSGNGHTWNYNSGTDYPQQNSTEKRFGSYSAYFDGYESGWSNQNAPWGTAHFLYQNGVVGSGDVTFDAWFKIENLSKWQYIYSERGVSYGWHVNYEPYDGKGEGRLRFNSRDYVVYTDINISDHDWHWVAVRRSGGQCSIWFDGKKSSDVKSCTGASGQSLLGARRCNHAVFQGWMDNVRLWNQGLFDDVIENQEDEPCLC